MKNLTEQEKKENKEYIKLFEDKYGFSFEQPTYEQIPFASKLFFHKKFAHTLSRIEFYLLNTFIINMNTNVHKEQIKLRHKFTPEEYKLHEEHNKLSINTWGPRITQVGLLNMYLKKEEFFLSKEVEERIHKYNGISFQDKIDYCLKLDKEFYKVLEQVVKNKDKYQNMLKTH